MSIPDSLMAEIRQLRLDPSEWFSLERLRRQDRDFDIAAKNIETASEHSRAEPGTQIFNTARNLYSRLDIIAAGFLSREALRFELGLLRVAAENSYVPTPEDDLILRDELITYVNTSAEYIATSTSNGQEIKDRFGFGKEVLTALIGILGTILGFYFGQSASASGTLQVAPAYVSNATPKVGDSVILYSVASGGKPPYKYSIAFSPNFIDSLPEKSSMQGVIQEDIKIPDKVPKDKDTDFTFQITVTDSTGKSVVYDDKTKKFTVKAEAQKK